MRYGNSGSGSSKPNDDKKIKSNKYKQSFSVRENTLHEIIGNDYIFFQKEK